MNLCANIDCHGNVLSVAFYSDIPDGALIIDELPVPSDGSEFQCSNFKFIDGQLVEILGQNQSVGYAPEPPSAEDRIAALESALLELILGGVV